MSQTILVTPPKEQNVMNARCQERVMPESSLEK